MRSYTLLLTFAVMSCDDGSQVPADSNTADTSITDAPGIAPILSSFVPSPPTIPGNTPTMITWTWTYVTPPYPAPACSIDNGVGPVTSGQATLVTLTSTTTFLLTCTNYGGTGTRVALVSLPPASPIINSFTVTPGTVMSGVPTNITFNWTYSTFPSPPPVCTIEGIGTATSGMTASVTLTGSRTYLLRCMNSHGTYTFLATVNVDECTSGTHDCQINANCVDNPNSFSCQCKAGYTGTGDVCSTNTATCATGTSTGCDPNALCSGNNTCTCNPGYVGSGAMCSRLLLSFTTLTTSTGAIGSLVAADTICQTAATNAGYVGTFKAWLSDSTSDAYCRIHNLPGQKATNCGNLAQLPVAAGPWARRDGEPVAPTIDRLLAPNRITYRAATLTETGTDLSTTTQPLIWTGTTDTGEYSGNSCGDWTSSSSATFGTMGEIHGGGTSWTDAYMVDPACSNVGRLRCMEVSSTGPALPSRHPVGRKVFLTSTSGNGQLSTWADANGATGIAAADQVCMARARYAGFANSQAFKAYISTSSSASGRYSFSSAYHRPDGVSLAISRTDLFDGRLFAAPYLTETRVYESGNVDSGGVWTGSTATGTSSSYYCYNGATSPYYWTSSTATGTIGRFDLADSRWWSTVLMNTCSATARLICIED